MHRFVSFIHVHLGLLLIPILLLSACSGIPGLGESELEGRSWCIFRGNATLNGYTQRRLPEAPVLQWTYRANQRTVASPIVYDGICYTCDRKGVLRGIDEQGLECFHKDLGTFIESNFLLQDSTFYIGRMDGFLSALSLHDGQEKWSYETEGQISASPNTIYTPAGRQILVGSYDNYMYALDANSGRLVNRFETGYYINGAAALIGHYMVFGGCDAWLRVVDTQLGLATDSLELRAYIPSSPVIIDDFAYLADYMGNIYEIQLQDGHIVNHRVLLQNNHSSEESGGLTAMPVVTQDDVFVFTSDRHLTCLHRDSGNQRWRVMLRGEVGESSPLVCHDRILVCTRDGHVSILSLTDGHELWHFEAGEQIISSPAIIRGAFYILTARGTLFRFTA